MNPAILVGFGLVAAYLLFSDSKLLPQPLNPLKAPPAAPGPAAQAQQQIGATGTVQGFTPQGSGQNQTSPNATLATINSNMVVANQALGEFDKLAEYFGHPSADSEYEVPDAPSPRAPTDLSNAPSGYIDSYIV